LILFDSNVKHSLMTSAYNEERAVWRRDCYCEK
jgi:hypothetical protein